MGGQEAGRGGTDSDRTAATAAAEVCELGAGATIIVLYAISSDDEGDRYDTRGDRQEKEKRNAMRALFVAPPPRLSPAHCKTCVINDYGV